MWEDMNMKWEIKDARTKTPFVVNISEENMIISMGDEAREIIDVNRYGVISIKESFKINKLTVIGIQPDTENQRKDIYETYAKFYKKQLLEKWDIDDWSYTQLESGKTCTHSVTVGNQEYSFIVRKRDAFGKVINPLYAIKAGVNSGIARNKGDEVWWYDYSSEEGWVPIRKFEEDELKAYKFVAAMGTRI